MAKLVCDYEHCSNEITPGTGSKGGLPLCKTCRGSYYRTKKLGVKWMEHRKEQLQFLEGRLDYLAPHIGKMISAAERRVAAAKKSATTRAAN